MLGHLLITVPAWFYGGCFFIGLICGVVGTVAALDRRGWLSDRFGKG